ncbi:MAG: acyltransferase [Aquabacterium sp.]|nr:acyltransferase [Aquabacterium sp.]
MASRRYHQIDLLRALACVMVLAFHYLHRGHMEGWVPFTGPAGLDSIAKFGYLGVQLFFAISGFVIYLSAQGATPRAFAASRAARLYPAFWASVVLTTAVVHLGGIPSLIVPWRDVFLNFTMVAHWFGAEFVDWAYWSLAVEFHFYIMIWILLRFDLMRHIKVLMAGWLLISLANYIRPAYPVEFVLEARWAPLFCVGICAYLMRGGDRSRMTHGLFFFASALSVAYAWAQAARIKEFSHGDLMVAVAVASAIPVLFWLISRHRFEMSGGKALYWAATLTYPVYLLHEYIGYVFMTHLARLGVPPVWCVLLVAAMVWLAAYVVHVYMERPLSKVIRRAVAGG